MQCERLLKLSKQWYLHVKDETMAPARMVQFIKQHVADCPLCQEDPDIQDEIQRITEIILPESKIPKAVRLKQEAEEAEARGKRVDPDWCLYKKFLTGAPIVQNSFCSGGAGAAGELCLTCCRLI